MSVNYGTSDGTQLHLNSTEIGYLVDGWNRIILGRGASTTGYLYAGTSNWLDNLTLRNNFAVAAGNITSSGNEIRFSPCL